MFHFLLLFLTRILNNELCVKTALSMVLRKLSILVATWASQHAPSIKNDDGADNGASVAKIAAGVVDNGAGSSFIEAALSFVIDLLSR
jgi:hypothetical protein